MPLSGINGKEQKRTRSIRVPGSVPRADVAEGGAPGPTAWGVTSGNGKTAPRNRKSSLGALTLGTKSNLDLEPGEEWHREVARRGGMLRRSQGISGLIVVRL